MAPTPPELSRSDRNYYAVSGLDRATEPRKGKAWIATLYGRKRDLFELTLQSARFPVPEPLFAFCRGVAGDAAETHRVMNAVCSLVPHTEVFNRENVRRLSERARAKGARLAVHAST